MATEQFSAATVATRRRSVGVRLNGVREQLDQLGVEKLGAALVSDLQFLKPKEREALDKVIKTMASCDKALGKISKALGVE